MGEAQTDVAPALLQRDEHPPHEDVEALIARLEQNRLARSHGRVLADSTPVLRAMRAGRDEGQG